jgi:hypothetical protein
MIIHYDQQKNLNQDTYPACASLGIANLFSAPKYVLLVDRKPRVYEHGVELVETVGLVCGFYLRSASCSPSHVLVFIIVLGSHHKSVYSSLLLLAISSDSKDLFLLLARFLCGYRSFPAWSCLSSIHSVMAGFLARPALSAEIHSPPQGLKFIKSRAAYMPSATQAPIPGQGFSYFPSLFTLHNHSNAVGGSWESQMEAAYDEK